MNLIDAKPIFAIARSGHPEVVIAGAAVFSNGKGVVSAREASIELPVRSLLKPWQFLAADSFDDQKMWALGVASHSGEAIHRQAIAKLLHDYHLDEGTLICPPSQPMVAAEIQPTPERRFHPCSGKHASFLLACQREGLPANYGSQDHPLQLRLKALVRPKVTSWVMDSCGVPCAVMSIGNHMQLWRELADEQKNQRVTLLKKLWLESPELTGGSARLDTALMLADRGNVLAKEGADGLLMVQSLPRPGHVPQGCFIKVSSGYSTAHLALALWAKLTKEKSQLNASFQLIYQYLDQHKLRWFPMDQELVLL